MRERPILFSGHMVRAILRPVGPKTQTRRVVGAKEGIGPANAKYGSGDRLWVRETWRVFGGREYEYQHEKRAVQYRADDTFGEQFQAEWRPSIFMPRWASRITLEITDVYVQRLQEIGDNDVIAEGIEPNDCGDADLESGFNRSNFIDLWDSINKKRCPWASNPWVWAITFRRVA